MSHLTFAPRDKEQRQLALIEAANTVFAERGYEAATTREIAERAGCAEGLIHRYFAGKRGLLLAILEHKGQHAADSYLQNVPEKDSVREEIEAVLLHELDSKWEKRDFMRICVAEASIDPDVGMAVRDGIQKRQVEFIAERLRRHQEAGRIRADVDTQAIAYAINGIGFSAGFMNRIAFARSRKETERIVLEAAAAITRGISTGEETPR
jgi:AcrR family transcriptional regulator